MKIEIVCCRCGIEITEENAGTTRDEGTYCIVCTEDMFGIEKRLQ